MVEYTREIKINNSVAPVMMAAERTPSVGVKRKLRATLRKAARDRCEKHVFLDAD